jgi:putative ABC transport system permease protein
MSHQVSIFCGLMNRTSSQIDDVEDANLWVMDAKTQYLDEVKALPDQDLYRIRGVEGVQWAVPLFKGTSRARGRDGKFRGVILMGFDDASLVGLPRSVRVGDPRQLREPETMAIDETGYRFFFPGEPYTLGRTLDLNDHTLRIVAIINSSAPFVNLPVVYTRYTQARELVGRERNQLSFVLARPAPGVTDAEAARRITERTGLKALTANAFGWETIWYYIQNTGIPINFGIAILLGFLVGVAIAGQMFYNFTLDNLKYFGAMKAMGCTSVQLLVMVALQGLAAGHAQSALMLAARMIGSQVASSRAR